MNSIGQAFQKTSTNQDAKRLKQTSPTSIVRQADIPTKQGETNLQKESLQVHSLNIQTSTTADQTVSDTQTYDCNTLEGVEKYKKSEQYAEDTKYINDFMDYGKPNSIDRLPSYEESLSHDSVSSSSTNVKIPGQSSREVSSLLLHNRETPSAILELLNPKTKLTKQLLMPIIEKVNTERNSQNKAEDGLDKIRQELNQEPETIAPLFLVMNRLIDENTKPHELLGLITHPKDKLEVAKLLKNKKLITTTEYHTIKDENLPKEKKSNKQVASRFVAKYTNKFLTLFSK